MTAGRKLPRAALPVATTLVLGIAVTANRVSAETSQEQVVQAGNAFATDLYAQLASRDRENLFFSPFSIHTAMAMTLLGARGTTSREMAKVLHLEMKQEGLLEGYDALLAQLSFDPQVSDREGVDPAMDRGEVTDKEAPASQLRLANALWAERRYPFDTNYLERVRRHFRARLDTLDFSNRPEPAREVINHWVETQTCNRIKDLIPPGLIDRMTRLVLTNTIYFQGSWEDLFPDHATKDRPFYLLDGDTVQVPQMWQAGDFDYVETDGMQLLSLPYRGHGLDMVVLLPTVNDGLSALEKRLTIGNLTGWLAGLKHQEVVEVTLPKWKFESGIMLKEVLRSMGVKQAFLWPGAGFTGMSRTGQLCIDEVIHKALVAVDEKGTEAAAATAAAITIGERPLRKEPPKPLTFTADHPFIFLIRHQASGAILFLGRVTNPKPATS
jgi:serpin B